jgi:hypothetical protein
MTAEERRERMLRGPILRTALTLAAPNALMVMAQTAVTIAAAAYVGRVFSLSVLGLGARGLYACVALGITAFSAILAYSTRTRAWRPDRA